MMVAKYAKLIKYCLCGLGFLGLISWGIHQYRAHLTPQYALPPVIIQQPKMANVSEYVTQTGTVVAYHSVDLVARIEGFLAAIEFTDGVFVKPGQTLFVVEPEPYLDQLNAAKAEVTSQQASLAYAKIERDRQQKMYRQKATSLNSLQEWETKVVQSEADLQKATANARNAEITYSYTHVLAPFAGRMGRHLVDIGNLVGNGVATKLATIEQIDPIYVYFNLNELDLLKLRASAKQRGISPQDLSAIPVYVSLQNKADFSHQGTLNFVNTGLNASTGTIEFRALVPNPDLALLTALFAEVRVPIHPPEPQLTIPEAAVQYDQIGPYVYIVDPSNTIVIKRIVMGPTEGGYRAIKEGLLLADKVVVSGLQNAAPGIQVTPITANKADL